MKFIFTLCFLFPGLTLLAQRVKEDSTVYLQELIISANKIPETRAKVAQQVQVVTEAKIKELNVQTSADLISNTGVVAMQKSQQGGGSPQIRGFEASRVVLVVDGVRMNNLIYRAGHLQNIVTIDNNSLERAEILFGPASTIYGSDALGGVIHFRTKEVTLSDQGKSIIHGNAFARFGTVNNEKTTHLDLNIGGKRFGSFTSFTYSDFGDLRMGGKRNPSLGEEFGKRNFYVERSADNTEDVLVSNEDPYVQKFSGYTQYDLIQKFLYKTGNVRHGFNFQFSNSSDIPRYDRLTDPEGTGLRTAEWYYGPQKRLMSAYDLSVSNVGIADEMHLTLSYQNIEESRHDRRFGRPNRRNQIENVDVGGLTIDLMRSLGKSQVRYGFDGQLNWLTSTSFNKNVVDGTESPVASRYPGKNTMHYYALYFSHTLDVNERLTLNDGVRLGASSLHAEFTDKTFFPFPFDEVNQRNTYASANVGLVFRPDAWKLSGLISTGYRVPNIDDLGKVFDTSAGNSLIVPNPDVKPEQTVNFELSATRFFGDRVRWENTGYYTLFFNAIVTDAFTFNGQSTIEYEGQPTQVLANQNKKRAFITGFSSQLHVDLSRYLQADASVNVTRGQITEPAESPLDHIPPTFGRLNLRFRNEKMLAETFVNFNGWKRLDDYLLNSEDNEAYATSEGMPSWYTVNIRAGYDINKRMAIQAGVDNLLDLQYRVFSSGINAPGRNIFGTLRVNF